MTGYRWLVGTLVLAGLVVGLVAGPSAPARADDAEEFIGGAILGALLSGAFDRDYPPGSLTFGRGYGPGGLGGRYGYCVRGYGCGFDRPVWFYYPQAGVFAFPGEARPYPYGIRWWQYAGRFSRRLVFVPAMYQGWGGRELVRFPAQRPAFVLAGSRHARYGGYGYGGYGGYGGYDPYGRYGGYGGKGGYVWQRYGEPSDWQPSPTLRYYRFPGQGWRVDWDFDRDGWYDLEANSWRRPQDRESVKAPGAGKPAKPPAVSRRAEADQDDDEPQAGPPQKVKAKLDESWRSEMRPARQSDDGKLLQPGGGK